MASRAADSVVLEAAPNQWAARLKLEGQDAAGHWQVLAAAPVARRRAAPARFAPRGGRANSSAAASITCWSSTPTTARTTCVSTRTSGECARWANIKERDSTNCHETVSGSGRRPIRHYGDDRRRDRAHSGRRRGRTVQSRRGTAKAAANWSAPSRAASARPARRPGWIAATVHFEAACFGMSGGPDDKREILAAMLRADRLVVTNDAVIALAGATPDRAGNYHDRRHRVDRLRTQCGGPYGARRAAGATFSAMKAADSTSRGRRCARRCGWRKAGVRRPRCAKCCWRRRSRRLRTRCCIVSIPTSGRGRAWRRWRGWWMRRRWNRTRWRWRSCAARRSNWRCWRGRSASELWSPGSTVEVAYIGGVFQSRHPAGEASGRLVELQEGVRCRAAAQVRRRARCGRHTGAWG